MAATLMRPASCSTPRSSARPLRVMRKIPSSFSSLRPPAAPLGQPAAELGLEPPVGGSVVLAVAERGRQVVLIDPRLGRIVGVLVALAIAEVLHQARRGIADVER